MKMHDKTLYLTSENARFFRSVGGLLSLSVKNE